MSDGWAIIEALEINIYDVARFVSALDGKWRASDSSVVHVAKYVTKGVID